MRFAIFPLHLSKVLRLRRKSDARSYEVLRLSRKINQNHLPKTEDLMLQNATSLRKSAPGPPNMSLVLRLPRKMHLCRSSSNVPRLLSFLKLLQNPHVLLTKVHKPLRLPRETTSEWPKVLRTRQFFDLEMCFAPQRRALFRHLNFQKWSEHGVLCTF